MEKDDKKNLFIVIIVILAIIVPVITYLIDSNKQIKENVRIVTNYNDFFTVDSCIGRVITYINAKDNKSLFLVTNDKYKKKNKLNINNIVVSYKEILDESNFISRKMYYTDYGRNIKKFYIYGENTIEDFDGIKEKKDIYFIVYLDSKKKTFSIEPYDGKIFLGGDTSG